MASDLDYSQWKEEYGPVLKSLSDNKVLMLFSGGKDSSLVLDYILRAGGEFNFDFEVHAGAFPVHRYTDTEKRRIGTYWTNRGISIVWHELAETDEIIEKSENPCFSCQTLRKEMLKTVLPEMIDDWDNLVIVTSYSLWDIVSYSLENIVSDIFSISEKGDNTRYSKRFMETAQRFYPLFKMKEGYTIFRPLIKYNSSDVYRLISEIGMPTLSVSCKFGDFRPKRILERYYEKMGLRFDYDKVFNFAKNTLNIPHISSYTSIKKEEYLRDIF